MKTILSTFLLSISVLLNAQVTLESLSDYKAIDDSIYQSGCTITLNKGSVQGYFKYIYSTGFSYKKEIENQSEKNLPKALQQKYPFDGKSFTIKEFIKRVDPDGEKVYALITDGINKYYMDFDNAIQYKEYINEKNRYLHFNGELMGNREVFLCYLKVVNVNSQNLQEYMYRFDKAEFMKYRNDEFEFHDKMEEWKSAIEMEVKLLKTDLVFVSPTKLEFGDYDFDGGYFPIELTETSYFTMLRNAPIGLGEDSDYKKTGIRLFFENTDLFNQLKMDKEQARQFIESKKSTSGKVNRELYTLIHFTIEYNKTQEKWSNANSEESYPLVGKIEFIEVFDSKDYLKKIQVIK